MMRPNLILILLASLPAYATLQISSASIATDGITITATMNGNTLTGSTSGCFTISGGSTDGDTVISGIIVGASANVTVTSSAPLYGDQTITIGLVSLGGGCALAGSTGVAATSSAVATNSSEWHSACGSFLSSFVQLQGSPKIVTFGTGYPNTCNWQTALGSLDFNFTGSEVDAWVFNYTSTWAFSLDGAIQACPGSCITPNAADTGTNNVVNTSASPTTYSKVVLATGISGGVHAGRIIPVFGQAGNVALTAIRFVGGGPTGSKPAAKPFIMITGDSLVSCCGSGPVDSMEYDVSMLGFYVGMSVVYQGGGSSGALVSGSIKDSPGTVIPFGGDTPTLWIAEGGANDQNAGTNLAAFEAAYETYLCNISNLVCNDGHANTGPAPTQVLAKGITPNTFANSIASYNTQIQTACTNIAVTYGVSRCKYYSTNSWMTTTTPCPGPTRDGTHFCGGQSLSGVNGGSKLANNEEPILDGYLNGSSYTLSCPGTATRDIPISCTLTLRNTATWTGALEPMTISDGSSGTFCLSGVCGNGTFAHAPPSSGGSYIVTWQPTGTGSRTITTTAGVGVWIDPTPVTVTVSAPVQAPTNQIR